MRITRREHGFVIYVSSQCGEDGGMLACEIASPECKDIVSELLEQLAIYEDREEMADSVR